jgi:hypothetical protein
MWNKIGRLFKEPRAVCCKVCFSCSMFEDFSKICRENSSVIKVGPEYMQTSIHFWSCLTHFLLEWEVFQKKVVVKIRIRNLYSVIFFFFRKRTVYEICGKILLSGAGPRWQHGTCAVHAGYLRLKLHTHTGCVILLAFELQHWLHARASMLLYTYIHCLSCYVLVIYWRCNCSSHP